MFDMQRNHIALETIPRHSNMGVEAKDGWERSADRPGPRPRPDRGGFLAAIRRILGLG
ncbi:MAG: hypothetical protein ACYC6T_14115 [Thermoleophilia bacterium]